MRACVTAQVPIPAYHTLVDCIQEGLVMGVAWEGHTPFHMLLMSKLDHELQLHSDSFRSFATKQVKLKLIQGNPHILSNIKLVAHDNCETVDLRVVCCVAISPHLQLGKGKRVPASRICNVLQVSLSLSLSLSRILVMQRLSQGKT